MALPIAAASLAFDSVGSGAISISWTDPNSPDLPVTIYASSDGSTFALIATLLAGVVTYTASNLSPLTSYSFKVGLTNGDGETLTDAISTTTAAITPVSVTPTLGLTFSDLILRVAEYLGVADYSGGVAAIPTDAHDLDMCKRLINDGYARFFNEYKWEFLNVEMQLAVDGVNYRFDLPYDFQGEFLTRWTNPESGPGSYLEEVSEEHIRQLRAGRASSGDPYLYAIHPKNDVDETTSTARWQCDFWPTPIALVTLTARYRRFPMKLTNLTDRSIAGPMHDQAIRQVALAEAELQRYGEAGPMETKYQSLLSASIKRDVRNVPKTVGYNGDNSDCETRIGRGVWPNAIITYNGIST